MICNNCGKTIRDRSAFCEFCGSKQMVYMPEDATVVQQNNMKYEDPYVQFGEPFYDTTNNDNLNDYKDNNSKKKIMIVLGTLIGVLVIAIAILIVMIIKKDDDKEISTQAQVETTTEITTQLQTENTTEATTQEQTEAETYTTTEIQTENQTEMPSEESGDGEAVSESVSCLGGTVIVELDSYNSANNIVTLKVTNNNDKEITTFGLPTAVIDGKSVALNDFDNMSSHSVVIQPGSFTTIEYVIDGAFFDHGGKINGEFHILNPSLNDRSYSLEISF